MAFGNTIIAIDHPYNPKTYCEPFRPHFTLQTVSYATKMETYVSSILRLIVILRLFGLDLNPSKTGQCKYIRQFLLIIAKCFHFIVLGVLSSSILTMTNGDQKSTNKFMHIMLAIVYTVYATQNVGSRFVIGWKFKNIVRVIDETNKLIQRFNGKEQQLLKGYKTFIRVLSFYPLVSISEFALNVYDSMDSVKNLPQSEKPNAKGAESLSIQAVISLFVTIPIGYAWIGVVESVILANLTALILIFHLVEKSCERDDELRPLQQMVQFISLHRAACKLVQMTNHTLKYLVIFWTVLHICLAFFHALHFQHMKTGSSFIIMFSVLIMMSTEVICAGLVNRMVHRSLRKTHQLLCNFPTKMRMKLSAKLELYNAYIDVSKPYLTIGGLTKLNTSAIIVEKVKEGSLVL
ncbi:hypothetical protein CHUAL_009937 [Chamberlinius hualienensis]